MKCLMVVPTQDVYFFKFIDDKYIATTYNTTNKFLKQLFMILSYIDVLGILNNLIYGKWYKLLKKGYNVVFLDGCSLRYKLRKIINKYKNAYVYFWNPAFDVPYLNKLLKLNKKIATFDESDSIKYDLLYLNTFYEPCDNLITNESNIDLFFVGNDKGRKQTLDFFRKKCDEYNLKHYIYIPKNSKEQMSYNQYLEKLCESRVILEIVQMGQTGNTMRMMEALFYKKKVITNNKNVIKMDFYDPTYIYVFEKIDDLNFNDVVNFLDVVPNWKTDLIEQYRFCNWIEKFNY